MGKSEKVKHERDKDHLLNDATYNFSPSPLHCPMRGNLFRVIFPFLYIPSSAGNKIDWLRSTPGILDGNKCIVAGMAV